MSALSYLDRFLDPVTEVFTPQLAQKIAEIHVDSDMEKRIDVLRRKANEGTLTSDEDAEYKDFIEAVDVISIIQAKARQYLVNNPA